MHPCRVEKVSLSPAMHARASACICTTVPRLEMDECPRRPSLLLVGNVTVDTFDIKGESRRAQVSYPAPLNPGEQLGGLGSQAALMATSLSRMSC